jgi:adenylate cyclase
VTPPGQQAADEGLFHPTGALCSLEVMTAAAQGAGFINIGVDPDGMLRRLPLVMARDGQVYPALSLSAVRAALGSSSVSVSARPDGALHVTMGPHAIALDEEGTLGLRFRAQDQAFTHISAADVLNGRLAPSALDNRIVFLGATALGVRDAVPTPVRARHPGIEVHATAAENLLAGTYIVMPSYRRGLEALTGVLLALLAAFAVGRLGVRQGAAAITVLVIACWAGSAWLLQQASVFLSPVVPSAILLVSFGAVALTGLEFERRRADGERHRRRQAHEFVVKSLTSLTEMRDVSTGRHSRRTQGYARLLAQRLAFTSELRAYLTPDRVELISLLAPLHDIGKVGIRDAILNKPSPLTPDEMAEMKLHPVYGFETIAQTQRQVGIETDQDAAVLQLAKDIVHTHHERWDGEGYPRGLKGTDIPIPGRIMAVVDVYDALVESRPYRRPLSHDEAVALIVGGRGTQFDPQVIEAFLAVSQEFLALGARFREMSPAVPG